MVFIMNAAAGDDYDMLLRRVVYSSATSPSLGIQLRVSAAPATRRATSWAKEVLDRGRIVNIRT